MATRYRMGDWTACSDVARVARRDWTDKLEARVLKGVSEDATSKMSDSDLLRHQDSEYHSRRWLALPGNPHAAVVFLAERKRPIGRR